MKYDIFASPEEKRISDNMLRRVRMMAEFIRDRYPNEFDSYWENNWIGKAEGSETIEFFSRRDLEDILIIMRTVKP
jgi:hypothetical protein